MNIWIIWTQIILSSKTLKLVTIYKVCFETS